ncbi:hypothetical protein NFJ02_24g55340 [Pycnococcus provasolii]
MRRGHGCGTRARIRGGGLSLKGLASSPLLAVVLLLLALFMRAPFQQGPRSWGAKAQDAPAGAAYFAYPQLAVAGYELVSDLRTLMGSGRFTFESWVWVYDVGHQMTLGLPQVYKTSANAGSGTLFVIKPDDWTTKVETGGFYIVVGHNGGNLKLGFNMLAATTGLDVTGSALGEKYIMSTTSTAYDNFPLYSTTNLQKNQWHHVAVSIDFTAGGAKLYVDGSDATPAGATACTGGTCTTPLWNYGFALGNPFLRSGMFPYARASTNDNFPVAFNGFMKDIRIWDSVRTSGEISANYRKILAGNEANLKLWYPMSTSVSNPAENQAAGTYTLAKATTNNNSPIRYGTPPVFASNPSTTLVGGCKAAGQTYYILKYSATLTVTDIYKKSENAAAETSAQLHWAAYASGSKPAGWSAEYFYSSVGLTSFPDPTLYAGTPVPIPNPSNGAEYMFGITNFYDTTPTYRNEAQIDFTLGSSAWTGVTQSHNFFARYSAYLTPASSGTHSFRLTCTGTATRGCRLYIDDNTGDTTFLPWDMHSWSGSSYLLIDESTGNAAATTQTKSVTAGTAYRVYVVFYCGASGTRSSEG